LRKTNKQKQQQQKQNNNNKSIFARKKNKKPKTNKQKQTHKTKTKKQYNNNKKKQQPKKKTPTKTRLISYLCSYVVTFILAVRFCKRRRANRQIQNWLKLQHPMLYYNTIKLLVIMIWDNICLKCVNAIIGLLSDHSQRTINILIAL
jgi:cation transport ATPase